MNVENPNPPEPTPPKQPPTSLGRLDVKKLPPRSEPQDEPPRKVKFQPDEIYRGGRGDEEGGYEDDRQPMRRQQVFHRNPAGGYEQEGNGVKQGGSWTSGLSKIVAIAVVIAIAVAYVTIPMWGVSKGDFETNIKSIVTDLTTAKAEVTAAKNSVTTAINGIPTTINTAVTNAMSQLTGQINTAISNANSAKDIAATANSKVDTQVTQLATTNKNLADINTALIKAIADNAVANKALVDALTIRVTNAEAKITALETPSSAGSGGSVASIPNVTMSVSVIDEGTLLSSDNSTLGQLKITMVNSGSKNIVDLTLSLYVYFNDCAYANQSISSSSYGAWSIRTKQVAEIELKGRLSSLSAGQTKRIYIDIKSFANNYQLGSNTTYMDASTSDLEVVDWNYSS